MNRQQLLKKYQERLHKAIKDKLEGKTTEEWKDIAKRFGCTDESILIHRHKYFKEYDDLDFRRKPEKIEEIRNKILS